MRLYRNVMQYADSKNLRAISPEVARQELLEEAQDTRPLYERGAKGQIRRFHINSWQSDREDEWKMWRARIRMDRRALKGYERRLRVLETLEARADFAASMLNLLSKEDCHGISRELEAPLIAAREKIIREEYPYSVEPPTVKVFIATEAGAHYERMRATFSITREAIMELPCCPVVDDCVILDARPAKDGVWFMRWAIVPGRAKTFQVVSGGYFEGELIMGYSTYKDVRAHAKDIQKISRHRAVTRALKG